MIGFQEQNKILSLIGSSCKRRLEAVIIGGSAMLFYNFQKTATKDIDIVVFSEDDREYLIDILKGLGFREISRGKGNEPVRMEFKEFILDVFCRNVLKLRLSEGMVARASEKVDFGNLGVSVISPEDIILSKSMTDRKGDRDDAASIIKTINVKWDTVLDECIWQSENGDPRFCIYLYDFLDDLVHDFGVKIPYEAVRRVKKLFRDSLDKAVGSMKKEGL